MRLTPVRNEEGFTMVVVMLAMLFISLVLVATVSAVNGDLRLTERDLDHKQAYEAAQAGVADYAYHLNNDTNYWSKCTAVPTPNAVNQIGSTTNRSTVARHHRGHATRSSCCRRRAGPRAAPPTRPAR